MGCGWEASFPTDGAPLWGAISVGKAVGSLMAPHRGAPSVEVIVVPAAQAVVVVGARIAAVAE